LLAAQNVNQWHLMNLSARRELELIEQKQYERKSVCFAELLYQNKSLLLRQRHFFRDYSLFKSCSHICWYDTDRNSAVLWLVDGGLSDTFQFHRTIKRFECFFPGLENIWAAKHDLPRNHYVSMFLL